MSNIRAFDYVEMPYMGSQALEVARRLGAYYHCVFVPCYEKSQAESFISQGFYYRPFATSQDISLEGIGSMNEYLDQLNAKRRNDIMQAVQKARKLGVEISIDVFRRDHNSFSDIYSWYFNVYRPYASSHFPNSYKYMFIEDLNISLLDRRHSFVLVRAKLGDDIIGISFLSHVPILQYQHSTSFKAAFPSAEAGHVLQMYVLNSWSKKAGNINTFLYYCMIEWAIKQGYKYFSFGRENITMPPGDYLNVLGSKRSWDTTSVLRYEAGSQLILCNRKALIHLGSDYYLFHSDLHEYHLIYYANTESVPKVLSQWLEGDKYLKKFVYTKSRNVFSYLEKRKQRWNKTVITLCSSNAEEQAVIDCP